MVLAYGSHIARSIAKIHALANEGLVVCAVLVDVKKHMDILGSRNPGGQVAGVDLVPSDQYAQTRCYRTGLGHFVDPVPAVGHVQVLNTGHTCP